MNLRTVNDSFCSIRKHSIANQVWAFHFFVLIHFNFSRYVEEKNGLHEIKVKLEEIKDLTVGAGTLISF